jgi:hypothetical protein
MKTNDSTPAIYVPARTITKLPPRKEIKSAREVAGKNPTLVNLKDHPEFDGQNIVIFSGTVAQGDQSNYVLCVSMIYPDSVDPWMMTDEQREDYTYIVSTGSANVMDRVQTAIASGTLPFSGKLRRGGRAWFID